MDSDLSRQVRQVNRIGTQRWEIGPDGACVRELRSRLDLDSGYVSRMLRSLEADGLIAVGMSTADAPGKSGHGPG